MKTWSWQYSSYLGLTQWGEEVGCHEEKCHGCLVLENPVSRVERESVLSKAVNIIYYHIRSRDQVLLQYRDESRRQKAEKRAAQSFKNENMAPSLFRVLVLDSNGMHLFGLFYFLTSLIGFLFPVVVFRSWWGVTLPKETGRE